MITQHEIYTVSDMTDFLSRATSSQSCQILSAVDYFRKMETEIAQAIARDPKLVATMAQDALEAAILGMRRAIPAITVQAPSRNLWSRLFPRARRQARIHPSFDNDAFALYLACLFDAIHNLPALIAPPTMQPCSIPNPAREIAGALACLRLLPVTSAAADSRFERWFMARESALTLASVP